MNDLTRQFLTRIGVNTDTLEKISAEELPEDITIDGLASSFTNNIKALSKNDPDLIKGIRDEIRGTELSKIEHRIKKTFDLSSDDVKDKKFEEILEVAHEKALKASGSTSEELQSKIVDLNNKVKQYEEEIIPSERQKAKEAISIFRRDLAIQGILSKKNLIVSNEVILPALNNTLSGYIVEVNENNEIEVKTKEGLKPLNSDGTKTLSFEDIIDGTLTSMNVIKQSNGNPDPGKTDPGRRNPDPGKTDSPSDTDFNLPGLKRAAKNAEGLSEMKTFGQ